MSATITPAAGFQSPAEAVAEAEARTDATAARLAAATAHHAKVQNRIKSLASERQGIISRRQNGQRHSDDGTRLELIAADTEGLSQLCDQAAAAEQAARAKHQEAETARANALQMLMKYEDEVAEAALVQHAEHLGGLLFETISKLESVSRRLGRGRLVWGPSDGLYQAIRKIQVARGML